MAQFSVLADLGLPVLTLSEMLSFVLVLSLNDFHHLRIDLSLILSPPKKRVKSCKHLLYCSPLVKENQMQTLCINLVFILTSALRSVAQARRHVPQTTLTSATSPSAHHVWPNIVERTSYSYEDTLLARLRSTRAKQVVVLRTMFYPKKKLDVASN